MTNVYGEVNLFLSILKNHKITNSTIITIYLGYLPFLHDYKVVNHIRGLLMIILG